MLNRGMVKRVLSVVKELIIGLAAGGLWKMHHWNKQRKTRAFYDLLERGEISVIAAEDFGCPCEFVGVLPWFDPPRHDTTRHRLGMGSNMYPSASASLLGNHKDESLADVPVEQLIENAHAFAI
ncbi:hypothetical protein Bca4012_052511 [Brassica carinata]